MEGAGSDAGGDLCVFRAISNGVSHIVIEHVSSTLQELIVFRLSVVRGDRNLGEIAQQGGGDGSNEKKSMPQKLRQIAVDKTDSGRQCSTDATITPSYLSWLASPSHRALCWRATGCPYGERSDSCSRRTG